MCLLFPAVSSASVLGALPTVSGARCEIQRRGPNGMARAPGRVKPKPRLSVRVRTRPLSFPSLLNSILPLFHRRNLSLNPPVQRP